MKLRLFALLFLLFTFAVHCKASENEYLGTEGDSSEYKPTYVDSYSRLLSLRLVGVHKFNNITVSDLRSTSVIYEPNSLFNIGVGFNYRFLGLNFAFDLPFINDVDKRIGDTRNFDFQANLYGRKIGGDVYVQSYKGYYISNPEEVDFRRGVARPVRGDIGSVAIGAEAYYVFNNDRFSYRASFVQNEWQKKSAGSWLIGPYFSHLRIEGDSSILPSEVAESLRPTLRIKEAKYSNLGLSGGYIYTWVFWNRFFLTPSATFGLAVTHRQLFTEDANYNRDDHKISYKIKIRAAMGYNSERFYTGVNYVQENLTVDSELGQQLSYGLGNIRFFIGWRFNVNSEEKSR